MAPPMDDGEEGLPVWSMEAAEVTKALGVAADKGLSDKQVEEAAQQIQKELGKPLWKLVLEQFDDTLVKLLLMAAFVS
eukprot:CAMPEP_0117687064 /NCGR_PEP_ID=MMETSP0804-20121206/22896_1 /TAXON_ID=1074897 /ORGANISM="Tetraselmis astigmatica, Strain CCMP880" /LENGTH=77 /DNA_ID=CAMNT_0005499023 /DNA_START=279 /DNA_END=508 /DNA_ORIENTATION=+